MSDLWIAAVFLAASVSPNFQCQETARYAECVHETGEPIVFCSGDTCYLWRGGEYSVSEIVEKVRARR